VRDLRAYVAREAKPDAAVVVNLPPSDPFFQYYSLARPTRFISDAHPEDRAAGLPALEDIAARSSEIWLLPFGYGDEVNHFVESYLGSAGFKTEDRWFGNLRLVRYSLAKGGAGPRHDLDAAATFVHPNGRVRLAGYRLAPERARPATRGSSTSTTPAARRARSATPSRSRASARRPTGGLARRSPTTTASRCRPTCPRAITGSTSACTRWMAASGFSCRTARITSRSRRSWSTDSAVDTARGRATLLPAWPAAAHALAGG
jgi:hypothetical protein